MECHADMDGNVGCKQAAGSLSAQRRPATASGFRATGAPPLPERSAEPIGLREADVDLQRVKGRRHHALAGDGAAEPVAERRFPSKKGGGPAGLINLGNTCFMASTLQCLMALPPLSKFFLDKEFFLKLDIKSRMRGTLALSFSQLIFKVHESVQVDTQQAVSPAALKERVCKFAPQFIGSNQQDCQEFLIFFIDGLCEDLHCEPDLSELILDNTIEQSKHKKLAREAWVTHMQTWGNGAIHQLFRGQFQSRITCMECLNDSFTYDPFLDLSLPIPHDGSQGCSLIDCLKAFTATEVLDQAEAYFCEHCKAHRQAAVQLSLRRCPPIVCIQIKRFSYTEVSREKLETPLDVPELGLDFAPFMALDENETARDDYIYDLHAISQHSGGLGGGHYTAVVKGREQWFVCDDSVVRPAADDGSEFSGSAPYVLFYVRRGYSMDDET